MTQRMLHISSPLFIRESELSNTAIHQLFPRPQPLVLEIGCGIGDFIVQLAAANLTQNYLAIDIFNKGCLKTCRRLEKAGLDNVRVMRIEARYLLTRYLKAASLAAVYVNCPDPWPKKRHRDRRLINAEFMQLLLYVLQPNGDFFFSTDFTDYAEQVAELLPQLESWRNQLPTPSTTELPGYPISKYMRRFLDLGQPIHFVHYRKRNDLPAESIVKPTIEPGFRTAQKSSGHE
jgi:tRNA (guanine-N7-)-methyltransferase